MSQRYAGEAALRALLARPWSATLACVALVALAGALATGIRPDFSIELLFPSSDPARLAYDRFKEQFPLEDAHALVVVEAPDLFTPAGLRRLDALERELGALEGVARTEGLLSVDDVTAEGDLIAIERLIPSLDLGPEALAEARRKATSDPLFVWRVSPPAGDATILRVTLEPAHASEDARRTAFYRAASAILARHEGAAQAAGSALRLTLSGMPAVRAAYTELILRDTTVLNPLAFLLVIVLFGVAYPSVGEVVACALTIGAASIWALGAMGACEIPLQILTQITPIVVMIVSVSDTAHIVSHHREGLAAGLSAAEASAAATAESALPCLLTELTIAGGFLGLVTADTPLIAQFGVATALGVLLAWLANMTVLPLALRALVRSPRGAPGAAAGRGRAAAALSALVGAIERCVTRRPRAVFAVAALIVAVAAVLGARVGREHHVVDDLRESHPIVQAARAVERAHGGIVPLAFHVEAIGEAAAREEPLLDPRALALLDRLERRLEAEVPEAKNALSLASYLRKAHRLLLGEEATRSEPLPTSRAAIAQELLLIDDGELLADVLTFHRDHAAVMVDMPDVGSTRAAEVIALLRRVAAEERAALGDPPFEVTLTGQLTIADAIYRGLVGGLARSLGVAILVTLGVFCLVLRSWRLALIGLVPNLLPLLLTVAVMSLLGIDLKVSTVIVFSITLVIADDDTIQYLTRFRRQYDHHAAAGDPDPHRTAALEVLRGTGAPMLVTTLVIATGFGALLASEFGGLANLGLLIGVSLLTAVFADLFLSPLLLLTFRPRIGAADRAKGDEQGPAPAPGALA